MTKKDYIAIGAVLNNYRIPGQQTEFVDAIANSLCYLFSDDNPRFNRERFLSYVAGECGPNGGKVQSC